VPAVEENPRAPLEKVHTLLPDALRQALAAKEICTLYHPYPVSFDDLYQAMQKVLVSSPAVATHELLDVRA